MTTHALGPVRMHGLVFDVAALSAQGPRAENQDAFSVDAFASTGVLAVADGMGGEKAGRVAADTALSAVLSAAPIRSLDAARYAVRAADEAVARSALESPGDRAGMGCALALLAAAPDRGGGVGWIGAHVGDVRILSRSPDGTTRLETRDHTPAFARWEAGEIALDEIPDTPGANRLQRAVGRGGEADAAWLPLRAGWSYLLVSDGITKAMRLDELGAVLAAQDAEEACRAIERKVEERGPDDNYTAVVVRVLDGAHDPDVTRERTEALPARAPAAAAPPRPGSANTPPVFNPPTPVTQPRRGGSPLGAAALALSLLALALGGYAAWAASRAGSAPLPLEARVDSLERVVASMRPAAAGGLDTLTAAAGDTAALPPPPGAAAGTASQPAAPSRTQP